MVAHATMEKFGYPQTLVKEYTNWVVCLRPAQPTLGSLVLICKEDKQAFSDISADAFSELQIATKEIERSLKKLCQFEKINYLMLMMVDKEVHFHVIPRYADTKVFDDVSYKDNGWPAVPDLGSAHKLSESEQDTLMNTLKNIWNEI